MTRAGPPGGRAEALGPRESRKRGEENLRGRRRKKEYLRGGIPIARWNNSTGNWTGIGERKERMPGIHRCRESVAVRQRFKKKKKKKKGGAQGLTSENPEPAFSLSDTLSEPLQLGFSPPPTPAYSPHHRSLIEPISPGGIPHRKAKGRGEGGRGPLEVLTQNRAL